MKTKVCDSQLHQAIANLARYLECNVPEETYGFLDGGQTLEISAAVLASCREEDQWSALEQAYQLVNGNIYSPDDDDWEVINWS